MERDELFEAAAKILVEAKMGSRSLLQRRLKIGYSRACRIMEQMEKAGIVGEETSTAAPRKLLVTEEGLKSILSTIKKLYFKFDPNNGEPWIIDGNLDNLKHMIQSEMETIKKEGDEEDVELHITFVWMTDEELEALPDPY